MALLDFLKRKKEDTPEILPVLPKDIYAKGALDLVDAIAPTALKISPREIELGEKFVRAFYTISYPRFLADSWFSPVINLDKVLDVSIFIHPIETEQALRGFQKKVAEYQIEITEGDIRGILDAKLVYTKPALFQQEQGFRSCLPLGTDELLVNSKLNS